LAAVCGSVKQLATCQNMEKITQEIIRIVEQNNKILVKKLGFKMTFQTQGQPQ
jgi:hypothetical protein